MDKEKTRLAHQLAQALTAKRLRIVTAESCTGGGIAQAMTDIPGSSNWFDRGIISYSHQAKIQMLQVKQQTLDQYGAVSAETAIEMVNGALANSQVEIAVSVTGIAGPSGNSTHKPIGLVYIATKNKGNQANCTQYFFSGNREQIRQQTIQSALELCIKSIEPSLKN